MSDFSKPDHFVPSSTARDWVKKGSPHVVDIETFEFIEKAKMQKRIKEQEKEISQLKTSLKLIKNVYKKLNITLINKRIKDFESKKDTIKLIEKTQTTLLLKDALDCLNLSERRYKR